MPQFNMILINEDDAKGANIEQHEAGKPLREGGGVIAVGYAYGAQEVDAVPVSPLDQPLDWVVTERAAIKC